MEISVHTNVGKQRKANQDYADYFLSPFHQCLFVLCDGVGGHQAGDVASELTTKFIGKAFTEQAQLLTIETAHQWIDKIIHETNQFIYRKSKETSGLEGMGTTLIMALFVEDTIIIAHAGDSRAYAYRDNQLVQLTQDHSLVNELIRTGEITEEESTHHPTRNIVTQSIGVTDSVHYETQSLKTASIDMMMLCSDGLTNMVDLATMDEIFSQELHSEALGEQLIQAANDAGGKDNITIILVSDVPVPIESRGDHHA